MKTCRKCGVEKPLSEFHVKSARTGQLVSQCKSCANNRSRKHYQDNRQQHLDYAKQYIQTEHGQAVQKRSALKFRYGITLEQYNEMLTQQDGRCAICGTREAGGRWNNFAVDHDHVTGAVRSLLCHGCNSGLGYFRENPEVLRKAAEYVERNRQTTIDARTRDEVRGISSCETHPSTPTDTNTREIVQALLLGVALDKSC